ncbi:MAG: hypothetical protein OES47_00935 [Acidobacteriota bacterium]|nr:hypothetical protein [Acidobacteriota bacterium]
MKTKLAAKTARLTSLALALAIALLTMASGPVWAKEKREPLERFRARAFDINIGEAANLDIVIYEWTSPEERQALIKTFVENGNEALYDALDDVSEKGYLKLPQTLGYGMQYAWQVEVDGKRRIVLATDRPMGFLELSRGFRSRDYNVSLVILELDPETGEGEGTAIGGAELSINKETGRLDVEFAGTQPTRLTHVKKLKAKKKKKK